MSLFGKIFKKKDEGFDFDKSFSLDEPMDPASQTSSQGQYPLPPLGDGGLGAHDSYQFDPASLHPSSVDQPQSFDAFRNPAQQQAPLAPPQDSFGRELAHQFMQQQSPPQQSQPQQSRSREPSLEIVDLKLDALKSEIEALKAHIKHLEQLVQNKNSNNRW